MNILYLNDADGRKPKKLTDVKIKDTTDQLVSTLKQKMATLWSDNVEDIHIDQNVSTHIAYIIDVVYKRHKSVSAYVDSHEVLWMKDTIQNGKLSLDDMSYPNYAPRHQYEFKPNSVTMFDPTKELIIPQDGSIPIIVYSHVSRLTGQIFPLESIFKKIKKEYPNAICIADGAQMMGGQKIYTLEYTDAYITTTSKFVGAELNLGICKLSNQFKDNYIKDEINYPSIDLGAYSKEIYSTNQSLDEFTGVDFESHIQNMRVYLLDEFSKSGLSMYVYGMQDQAPHLITLFVGDKSATELFVESIEKKYSMVVSHNMFYSIIEPKTPLVRISISARCTKENIDILVSACKSLLKNAP